MKRSGLGYMRRGEEKWGKEEGWEGELPLEFKTKLKNKHKLEKRKLAILQDVALIPNTHSNVS